MADVNLAEVLAQANSLSSEERRLLANKLLRDLKVESVGTDEEMALFVRELRGVVAAPTPA